jgi:3-hydroxyacyl-[acyl-carrier-protein] dehydratase
MNRIREQIEQAVLGPVQLGGDEGQNSYCFGEDFIGFAGHFPAYPILPAVLQILLAELLAEQVQGEPLQFLSVERAKFTQPLRPGDRIEVRVSCLDQQGQLHCNSELFLDNQRAASFTLVLVKGLSA